MSSAKCPCCNRHIHSSQHFIPENPVTAINKHINTSPTVLVLAPIVNPYSSTYSLNLIIPKVVLPRDGLPVYLATHRLRI